MIHKRTGEVFDPEVDSTYWKYKIKPIFIVFIDHKITCLRAEELHILNGLALWIPGMFAIFHKNSSLPSFLSCLSNSSHCSFVISFTLVLVWSLISALSLRYFSTSCSTL